MSNKDPISWAEQASKQTMASGMGAIRTVVGSILSMLTLRLAIFLTKLLAMPLEVLYRKNAGVRYFSPFWLIFQTLFFAVLTVVFAANILTDGKTGLLGFGGLADSHRAVIVTALFMAALTWASGEHLFSAWSRILRRQLSYTMHEGNPRFLFPGVHLVPSQMVREILNDLVWTVLLSLVLLPTTDFVLVAALWLCAFSMMACRFLMLQQVWSGVFDAVDSRYLEVHREHVGELVDAHIETPLGEPFRKYLGKLQRPENEQPPES